jgi:replicative DNA helicase
MTAPQAASPLAHHDQEDPGLTPDGILSRLGIAPAPGSRESVGWYGDPVPLATNRLLPPFPADALPGWLAAYVAALAEATQTPVDLPGSLALACLSTAAGGRVQVHATRAWTEPVNLYTVVALPPGSRKSAVFRAMTKPLAQAESVLHEAVAHARIEAELQARFAHAHAETLAKKAETAPDPAAVHSEAVAAAEDAAAITVPELPRLTTDDVTPESCASLLARHGGRIAVLSAEGDAFATLTGTRYSSAPNLGVFLKGHAGDRLQIDRKGRDSETVDHPALTLGITTQPGTLAGLADHPGFRDRGVLARILYSLPENTVGRRKIDPDPVPEPIEARYTDTLRALVLSLADNDHITEHRPHVLTLHPDALAHLTALLEWLEPRLDPHGGQLAGITDWASKLAGAVVRIAALLHLADRIRTGYDQPISPETMQAAEQLGRYYLSHALAVFDLMGATDPDLDDARHALDWIVRTQRDQFTRRDLFNAVRGQRFAKVTELDPALDLLTEHGYIRERTTTTGTKGGRPSIAYDVHPATHADTHRRPAKPAEPTKP